MDVQNLEVRDPQNLAFVTQTTLSIDDTLSVVQALQKRFPAIQGPHKEDICYATTNRQLAVKEIAKKIDALLVVGAPNSSNSKRLVEVGKRAGCKYSQLVQRADEIDFRALKGIETLGVTAGASAPEILISIWSSVLAWILLSPSLSSLSSLPSSACTKGATTFPR